MQRIYITYNLHWPGPGTYKSLSWNLSMTDLNCAVPVELILTIMLWLLDTVLILGSTNGCEI